MSLLQALNRALAPMGLRLQRAKPRRGDIDPGRPMTRALCGSGTFSREPLTLIDVGCAGGIDPRWRIFGSQLRAWGIDAMTQECSRLAAAERNPNVIYLDTRLGIGRDHPVVRGRPQGARPRRNPWRRLSIARALEIRRQQPRSRMEALRDNEWHEQHVSPQSLTVDELLAAQNVTDLDFLKIDVDGEDFELLAGFAPHVDRFHTLGVKLEVNFFGTAEEDIHCFHNTDRLMRRHGFELFGLSTLKYSNASLPASFAEFALGPTEYGRVLQGDALYFRDPAGDAGPAQLAPAKLLKLACMFEIFDLPDCAAELLVRFGHDIGRQDTARLLDLLAPRLDGVKLSYDEYLARFNTDPRSFI